MKSIDLLTKVVFVFITFAFGVALAGEHFVPVTTYRTGPYAVTGAPAANGIVDILK